MTAISAKEDDRNVIPRWRSFDRTIRRGELAPLRSSKPDTKTQDLQALRYSFATNPNIFNAADLFSVLLSEGASTEESADLAEFILHADDVPSLLSNSAMRHIMPTAVSIDERRTDRTLVELASGAVSRLRSGLRQGPKNPVRWVDLSLAFATLGNRAKAERAMKVALSLAPDSRFVLRSASRLYVYLDDPEKANFILNASPRTSQDPWLLAAELSTASLAFDRLPRLHEGRELLATQRNSPFSSSELASEIATDEVRHGRDRRAKQMLSISLIDPTENAVAQAETLVRKAEIRVVSGALAIEGGFEARAARNSTLGKWDAAAEEAELWLFDQPFAVEPAIFATFSSAISGKDLPRALELAQFGLRVHPDDRTLLNNTAFILASMDQPYEARAAFDRIREEEESPQGLAVEQATIGLIEFREGNATLGRHRYRTAVDALTKIGNRELAAMTAIYWAAEEKRIGSAEADTAFKRAQECKANVRRPGVDTVFDRLLGSSSATMA